jgi:hypothetical protein
MFDKSVTSTVKLKFLVSLQTLLIGDYVGYLKLINLPNAMTEQPLRPCLHPKNVDYHQLH